MGYKTRDQSNAETLVTHFIWEGRLAREWSCSPRSTAIFDRVAWRGWKHQTRHRLVINYKLLPAQILHPTKGFGIHGPLQPARDSPQGALVAILPQFQEHEDSV